MKLNRSLRIIFLTVVLVLCTGILLNGCASVGKGKEAGPNQESSSQTGNKGTSAAEAGGSSSEAQKNPIVNTGGSGEKGSVQTAGLTADKGIFQRNAAFLKQAMDRIRSTKLPDMNWNRIATVAVGLLMMLMIYGLAFGLARLPARRRGAGRPGGRTQAVEQAGESAS